MKKLISTLSVVVILLFLLSLFGWMSVHIHKKDKDFGFLNEPIKFMYSFLDQFKKSVEEVEKVSPTFMTIWSKVEPINKLDFDLNILMSFSESDSKRAVAIRNLRNDSIVYKWNIAEEAKGWDRLVNPYVFPNKDLVYFLTDKSGLRRIDSTGNYLWKQDKILAHHGLNIDSAGHFWVCSKELPKGSATAKYQLNGRLIYYDDDCITRIDANTGDILFHRSLTEILKSNRLENYLLQAVTVKDPLHLNDIQPALKTNKYFREGDLFISIKQSSMILHYRPQTDKVLQVIEGPFSAQHDIDFYNDSTLTIFNNNSYPRWIKDSKAKPKMEVVNAGDFCSNIVKYNLASKEFSFIGEALFKENKIFTTTEGLHEFINDSTYFVEEQNVGFYWVIQNDQVIYKNQIKSDLEGYCHLPNWARIVEW